MPRLYREAPLASIWEGSGNVMSLDVLRALTRSPRSLEVFLAEVELAARRRRAPGRARADAEGPVLRPRARSRRALGAWSNRWPLCLQGSLLVRHAPPAVADAFCASRLAGDGGLEYGTLPAGSRLRGDHRARAPTAIGRLDTPAARPTIEVMAPSARNFQLARDLRHPHRRRARAGSSCCSC